LVQEKKLRSGRRVGEKNYHRHQNNPKQFFEIHFFHLLKRIEISKSVLTVKNGIIVSFCKTINGLEM